ncbi:MAG: TIGR03619 family F420-dependent LLM class oxidoreductase [Candidatus Binatia bacterium]
MQIGFFAIGIGPSADPELLALTARTVEQCGFHSLWTGEHVVLVSQYASKYPYAQDGRMPLPNTKIDFLDPFATLNFAAAHSKTVRLGTGICLVPERNPVVLAKEVASLDKLSGGRFDFGVGIGWLEEEFAAVGVPWERRADRTREYLKAMKLLWTEDEPEFTGEFCSFPKVCLYPKPVQKPHPPIVFGGESAPALRRVGEVGDGWFGVNVAVEDAKTKIERMRQYAQAAGRDPGKLHFSVSPGIGASVELDQMKRYRDAGVHQVIVGSIPRDPKTVQGEIERLAEKIVAPAAKL